MAYAAHFDLDPQSVYDTCDSSSDDGDQLHTPHTDDHTTLHSPVQVQCERVNRQPQTPETSRLPYHFSSPLCSFTSPRYLKPPAFQGKLSFTSLKNSVSSLDLDPFGSSCSQRFEANNPTPSVLQIPLSPSTMQRCSASENSSQRLSKPLSPGRKRMTETLSRSCASVYTPNTLASSYSPNFASGHHLQARFVRAYQLCADLGSGGYGFVMTARHRHERTEVAVKFIIKDKVPENAWSTDDAGKRVPMEAKMLSLLNHPGIVKFIDLFEDQLYFYLVQELHGTPWSSASKLFPLQLATPPASTANSSRNNSLHEILRESPSYPHTKSHIPECIQEELESFAQSQTIRPDFARRPSRDLFECIEQSSNKRLLEEDAKYIFSQVVDIVSYLDAEGITHRDIKDENLVVDENLKVKLIDFGSVVIADPSQPRPYYNLFYGTTAYASSEILRKHPYQASPAEMWTLGVLLSYLLTGASPFPTERHAIEGNVSVDTSSGARIHRSCLHLMKRCLHPNPEQRADIKEIKAHPWLRGALDRLR